MQAVILAAGSGTRLRPMTDDRPKCMVEVQGRPLLHIQLAVLRRAGASRITVVGGYLADRLATDPDVQRLTNPEYAATNMVWTLKCAARAIGEDCVISYGDIIYPPQVIEALLGSPHEIAVAVDLGWREYWERRFQDVLSDAETLAMDGDGMLREIGRKPSRLEDIQGQYIGLVRFRGRQAAALRQRLEGLEAGTDVGGKPAAAAYMTDLLQVLIDEGRAVAAAPFRGEWCEVDSPRDLALAQDRARGWLGAVFPGGDA